MDQIDTEKVELACDSTGCTLIPDDGNPHNDIYPDNVHKYHDAQDAHYHPAFDVPDVSDNLIQLKSTNGDIKVGAANYREENIISLHHDDPYLQTAETEAQHV